MGTRPDAVESAQPSSDTGTQAVDWPTTQQKRRGTLTPDARQAEASTLHMLEHALRPRAHGNVPEAIAGRLQGTMPRDIEELLPRQEPRQQEAQAEAEAQLKKRANDEPHSIRRVLEDQKLRVLTKLRSCGQTQMPPSLVLEKRQLESDPRYWDTCPANVGGDLQRERRRVRHFCPVASFPIEPVGLAYLLPASR